MSVSLANKSPVPGEIANQRFFEYLSHFNYEGPYIIQAYRDDEGISVFKEQLEWLKQNVPSL